jgi:predicted dehydrogenase
MRLAKHTMIGVGVIGYGYWGPNLARNFSEVPGSQLVGVCDPNPERLALAQKRFRNILTCTNPLELITNKRVEAVVIATPVSTHFELTLKALEEGKHVLVEKPLASSSHQVKQLIDEAARRRLVLMVGHTFIYSGAVQKIKELIDESHIGALYYFDSIRVNLGKFQHDVNVVWDLAVHDLAIIDYLIPMKPILVTATGMNHLPGQIENVAYVTLLFENDFIAHINVNWLCPFRIKQTLIGGSQKMIFYDDLDGINPVKVYDKGIILNQDQDLMHQMPLHYRWGDMWSPHTGTTESLRMEVLHFIDCLFHGNKPLTDGLAGLRVVQILESATRSMAEQGRPIAVKFEDSLDDRAFC